MTADRVEPRAWRLVWRVSYWRAEWTQPYRDIFTARYKAKRHLKRLAKLDPDESGPVVLIELEEKLVTDWQVVTRVAFVRDARETTDPVSPPPELEPVGESQATEETP